MRIRKLILSGLLMLSASLHAQTYSGSVVADEGAWCWFADPRAMHLTTDDGSVNAAYIGYIDVHGAVKATQMDFVQNKKEDVLVRSAFQPDDHNNPTFLELPDHRVMIFYARHTDEACFYYRVSTRPGDITSLGEEKKIVVANNTTYPSPFILSSDPNHFYLCWRGIGWHPTIARITLPDANDEVKIAWGPYQMVQSTGARPYAKYQSNGKDKIYVAYTTGHPDNENPNWLYFNVININAKTQGGQTTVTPQLADLKGNVLSTIANGKFNVSKTSDYKSKYPNTIIDAPSAYRDWVWQIVLDKDELPVVAMVRISPDKNSHEYYYARWNGSQWNLTDLVNAGGRFHLSNTEYCYSGGMSLDPDNVNNIYLSIPTMGETGKSVYEIWKYTVSDEGKVTDKQAITRNSVLNNVRPFILPGSGKSPLRLCWMNGDYYYWIVKTQYPLGYPTSMRADYEFPQAADASKNYEAVVAAMWEEGHAMASSDSYVLPAAKADGASQFTLSMNLSVNPSAYKGTFLSMGSLIYGLDATSQKPFVQVDGVRYNSQNYLGTSDNFAIYNGSGTDGKWYNTPFERFNVTLTYDGTHLVVYRNGWIDQKIEANGLKATDVVAGGFEGTLYQMALCDEAMSQQALRRMMSQTALETISLPKQTYTDLVLPSTGFDGQQVEWNSSNEQVISNTGAVMNPVAATEVTLTASLAGASKQFVVTVLPRNIKASCVLNYTFDEADVYTKDGSRYVKDHSGLGRDAQLMGSAQVDGTLNLTANKLSAFSSNGYALVPQGVLPGVRSYTVLLTAKPSGLEKAPRLYDFGSASSNSVFLRANALSAGIKYNGATTTMVNSPSALEADKEYKLAVSYNAATGVTIIYVNGEAVASDKNVVKEPWQVAEVAADVRNYIGRAQWWDVSSAAADNQDYVGTVDNFMMYNTTLSRKEICELQQLPFEEKQYSAALTNGDFEASYTVMASSGVSNDRAIYVPEGWMVEYTSRDKNDITALADGDLYFGQFFGAKAQPANGGNHTFWVRQRWGASTITFYQELMPEAGEYTLTADMWKSGLGGDARLFVQVGEGVRQQASPAENKEEWQRGFVTFQTDGTQVVKVGFEAMHNSDGNEKILGFDNICLQGIPMGIQQTKTDGNVDVYTLDGVKVRQQVKAHNALQGLPSGVYLVDGVKTVVR